MTMHREQVQTMIRAYFPVLFETPFADDREALVSWFRFVDLLCILRIYTEEQGRDPFLGRISDSDQVNAAIAALEPFQDNGFPCKEELREIFGNLRERGRETGDHGTPLFLERLAEIGQLEDAEFVACLLLAAADCDGKYAGIFEALHRKRGMDRPDLGLVCRLCAQFLGSYEDMQRILLDDRRFFRRIFCEAPQGSEGGRESGVLWTPRLNRSILQLFYGNPGPMDTEADGIVIATGNVAGKERVILAHEPQIAEAVQVCRHSLATKEGCIVNLSGAEGVGKKFLAATTAEILGKPWICVDVRWLLAEPNQRREAWLRDLVFRAAYEDGLIYLDLSHLTMEEGRYAEQETVQKCIRRLEYDQKLLLAGSAKPLPADWHFQSVLYRMDVPAPDAKQQAEFWKQFSKEEQVTFEADVELERLVSKYELTPAKIRRILQCVKVEAEQTNIPDRTSDDKKQSETGNFYLVTREQIEKQIRASSGAEFGIYATRIDSHYRLEDIGLTDLSRRKFMEACNRVKYRSVVNDTYGFKEKLAYGRGIAIVFYGPPGTGKTMAAQVMANELGLDIYRIDISQITNKYIGETQKNIGKLFDTARNTNAILFFDEADALFVKRTEVASSNDKHANSETAFLLQKMEEYSGVCILATNAVQNMDSAFKRRMTYMIEIGQPDEETRLKIWSHIFADQAPFAERIRFDVFAAVADQMTGSTIKSAALSAAYFAAAENRAITNSDIITAIDHEYTKAGRLSILGKLYEAMY